MITGYTGIFMEHKAIELYGENSQPFFQHHSADIEAISPIRRHNLSSPLRKRGNHSEDVVVPHAILIIVLVIPAENIAAVFVKADHAMQHQLIRSSAAIERDVIFFQPPVGR